MDHSGSGGITHPGCHSRRLLLPPPADPLAGQYFSAAFREEAAAYQQARLTVSLSAAHLLRLYRAAVGPPCATGNSAAASLAVAAGLSCLLLAAQLLDFPRLLSRFCDRTSPIIDRYRLHLAPRLRQVYAINLILTTGPWPAFTGWCCGGRNAGGSPPDCGALLMLIGSYLYPLLIDFLSLYRPRRRGAARRIVGWPPQPGSIRRCWWPMPAGAPARSMPTLRMGRTQDRAYDTLLQR